LPKSENCRNPLMGSSVVTVLQIFFTLSEGKQKNIVLSIPRVIICKGEARRGPGHPPIEMLFQVLKLNF